MKPPYMCGWFFSAVFAYKQLKGRNMSFIANMARQGVTADEKLHNIIKQGRSSADNVIQHIQNLRIVDKLAKADKLTFTPHEGSIGWKVAGQVAAVATDAPGTDIMIETPIFGIHSNAFGQLAQHAGVPGDYVRKMVSAPDPWRKTLICDVLNEHFAHTDEDKRLLMRTVEQEVRGAMSDRYKILDSAPIVAAFKESVTALDAIPSGGYVSDVRIGLRALHPKTLVLKSGQVLCLGIQLRHSEFGRGTLSVSVFVFRPECLNTAVLKNALNLRHLGRKMADNMALSQRTINLNTAAAASEVVDIVEQALAPQCRDTIKDQLDRADSKEVEFLPYRERIEKALGKGLCAKVKEAFEGEDVVNLPERQTLWRLSNAVSWVAHEIGDADRSADLERLAGSLLPGG